MVSTFRKKQQSQRLHSQLDEAAVDFLIGNANMSFEKTNVFDKRHENANCYCGNSSKIESGSRAHTQTLEKNISDKVKNEIENVVATVDTGVHLAIPSEMDFLVVPRMELAMSCNEVSWRSFGT